MSFQPTTLNMTFDTSLAYTGDADPALLNQSFGSSTESDPSLYSRYQTPSQATATADDDDNPSQKTAKEANDENPTLPSSSITPKPATSSTFSDFSTTTSPTPVTHLPTLATYDAWAPVYDTDGNMLQAIDDLELATLLPTFLNSVTASFTSTSLPTSQTPDPERTLQILDLGCGTGRNTLKLATHPYPPHLHISITGIDFSAPMLALARAKLASTPLSPAIASTTLHHADAFAAPAPAVLATLPQFDAIISTLVLEHVPLAAFWQRVVWLLKPGGVALVTNMHEEMGRVSQAGFVAGDGRKVRGESWAHGVAETGEVARGCGLEVLGVWERAVEEGDLEGGVGERGRKWVGRRVWFGVLVRKGEV
ncbi:S-adenosyl-L-methionine-dependent methyltransferase [Mytilinidion resinicola]|uniref:S-adenosyl-L-methionine-dependent methyltransferase n=1 Tax=Mytilinidion resinicola TaxID=574789 RepID=A0A6A6YKJ2_9PEZI|nr:S-adenosyl-L-methionine-dependent methyltransferase [Mytilinidion resinicola]KAF2809069.1 S-adenosyl-L-methionine-dependent methyltransferase [Mytilinidion resinicola]